MSRKAPASGRRTHRDALLDAAKELLRESGRGEITARDLVAASNTNLASIGYHFGGKDALLDEAARLVFEEWAETVTAAFRHDPAATAAESFKRSLERILDDFELLRPSFVGFIGIVGRSASSPEVRNELAAHYDRQRRRVGRTIAEWLAPEADPADAERLATFLMAVSDGLMLQLMIDPASVPSSSELMATCSHALGAMARASGRDAKRNDDEPKAAEDRPNAASGPRKKRRARAA